MSLYTAQSSRGAIFIWRQGDGEAVAVTGTAAPRPKWQLRSRGVRSFVYAKSRGADAGTSAVTADLSASYSIHQAGTADLAGSYTVDSSLTAVTADLAGSYAVHQQATADLAGSYTIDSSTTAVTADLVGSFAILGRLQIDLSGSYSIEAEFTPLDEPVFSRAITGTRARRIGQASH